MEFFLDNCPQITSGRLMYISGACVFMEEQQMHVYAEINNEFIFNLPMYYRHDMAKNFPELPYAIKSGFYGDTIIPECIADGEEFQLNVFVVSQGRTILLKEMLITLHEELNPSFKVRQLDLAPLIIEDNQRIKDSKISYILGVPHYLGSEENPAVFLSQTGTSHPHSNFVVDLIKDVTGYILDFGCGSQSVDRLKDNIIHLDATQYPYVDIVNTTDQIPFKDNTFEIVISQAVFEHVNKPKEMMQEIFRVLQPGGTLILDTAFMQPLHGDPHHYFNMTLPGLKSILTNFDIIDMGVRPYQLPSYGYIMQINEILPFVSSPKWHQELQRLLSLFMSEGSVFDECLGKVGQEVLAAGVYCVARKPKIEK